MKLKEHVLLEGKTIPVSRDGKRFVCRILQKGSTNYDIIAKYYGCSSNYFMDFTCLVYCKPSRRYFTSSYHPLIEGKKTFGFSTFEDAIAWLKTYGFKILSSIHRKSRFTRL